MECSTMSIFYIMLSAILSAIVFPVLGLPTAASTIRGRRNVKVELSQPFGNPGITQAITFRPSSYSAGYDARRDPFSSNDNSQKYSTRKEIATKAEEEGESYEAEDDRDMYMEDIDIKKVGSKETGSTPRPVIASARPLGIQKDNHQMGQHFFPSFAPVFSLGHSRPHQLFHQEPFFNSKARVASTIAADYNPFGSYRENSYKVPINFEDDAISTNILGSGNFGVLRGGTYYNEEDEYRNLYGPHFTNNGHGRPYYSNPRPQKYINGDFFANFRDFAEINTPAKASYSQYIVVYISGNGTKPKEESANVSREASSPTASSASTSIIKPKNIFEQLTLLDQRDQSFDYDQMESEEKLQKQGSEEQQKKTSLHKRKLALLSQEKSSKEKIYSKNKDAEKEFLEPLLALS